ncbi:hypothetical protein [uncultured Campylobacter sp.]|uniref:hypothetical protein n=1 Tax=uncultured Campylobacter sp. TaxID=218934 RepID=UPI00261B80EB|nr:hypothetical protein [uncultured Campylobacter sp.]
MFIVRFNGISRQFRILRRDRPLSLRSFGAAADNPSAARKPIKKFKCDDKTCYLKNLSAQTLAKF